MFATGNEERCPVMLFKVYLEKRPEEMKTTVPFYLSMIDKPVSNLWLKKTPMGKNTIDSIMKKMKLNSPLIDLCPDKGITNHSARKTVIKKLKSSGIPKCEIKNITGHTATQGLDGYDSGDEREQQLISNIIDNSGPATSRGVFGQLYSGRSSAFPSSAPSHVYNFNNYSVTLNIAGDNSTQKTGAPNGNFQENICSEDDLRTRIFGTFVVKFLACLPLLGFSNIYKMV